MLLFQVEAQPWAIAAADVKDLIPLAMLQPYAQLSRGRLTQVSAEFAPEPSVAAGLLNYHGERLPVLDVSLAIARRRASSMFSTRIAIVGVESLSDAESGPDDDAPIRCGLILEGAYETAHLSEPVSLPVYEPYVQQVLKGKGATQVVRQLAIAPLVHQSLHSITTQLNIQACNYRPGTA